jgi:hypothetical protein
MPNGIGLDAHLGNLPQQMIIVPKPKSLYEYYFFTITDEFWFHKLYYHEVSFMDNPLGEVTLKNNLLNANKLNFCCATSQ